MSTMDIEENLVEGRRDLRNKIDDLRHQLCLAKLEVDRWKLTCDGIRGDRDLWRRQGQEIIEKCVQACREFEGGHLKAARLIVQEIALLK